MNGGGFWRLAVLAAAALLLTTGSAASASPAPPVLTVIGAGNSSAPLLVRRTTTLHFDLYRNGLGLSGGKTYVGLAVHDSAGALMAAAVQPKHFRARGQALSLWLGPGQDKLVLEPGRYRMTLLADGPARATVRASGLGAPTRLTTRDAVRGVDAAVLSMRSSAGALTSGSSELDVAGKSTLGVFTFAETDGPAHTERWYCLRALPASCSATSYDFKASTTAISIGGGWVSTSSFSTSGAPAGAYLAGTGAATVSTRNNQAAFAMSIPGVPNR